MMKKMMKMGAALSAVALAVSACFSFDDTKNTYEANVLVHYEPDSVFEYEDFIHQFFKDGADSVSINEYLTIGPVTHFSKLDADKNLIGGFALCTGIDEPKKIFVQNVQAVVQAAKNGVGLSGGPFTSDDFLTLTLIGYRGNTSKGNLTVKLVDGTKILEKWTEVDLSSMGGIDRLELHLEASRPDCPLYCCIDDLYFHYRDVY